MKFFVGIFVGFVLGVWFSPNVARSLERLLNATAIDISLTKDNS